MVAENSNEPCLAVIVPCFNEVNHVVECVNRVLLEPVVQEVLVVNDGSTDGTDAVLTSITDPRVRVLHHQGNYGKGAALRTGFSRSSADLVITQDADLEQNPADYSNLVKPILADVADVVYGSRFIEGRRHVDQKWLHHLANLFLTWLSNHLTGLALTDMETGYKVFRREVLEGFEIEENRFGVEPEITAKVALSGWRVREVPVAYEPRNISDGKKIGWRDGIRAVICIVKYSHGAS